MIWSVLEAVGSAVIVLVAFFLFLLVVGEVVIRIERRRDD